MKRIVDFDEKEREWSREIDRQMAIIADADIRIAEANRIKDNAEQEIARLKNWLRYAQEITGTVPETQPTESNIEEVKPLSPNMKLPEAILRILAQQDGKRMRISDFRKQLSEAGFTTDTQHFNTVLRNAANRLVERGEIQRIRKRNETFYSLKHQN